VFGHASSILTFQEGLLGKYVRSGESKFYQAYETQLHRILPPDLVPQILGLLYLDEATGLYDFQRSLQPKPTETRPPMLLQRDVAAGYVNPAIIDLKLGTRSWRIGASAKKAARRSAKMAKGTCFQTCFRVRAALWSGVSDQFERISGTSVSFVSRSFGNTCTMDELKTLFADFFRYKGMIPTLVEKLGRLKSALEGLRAAFDTRFYSSSIIMVYDSANPEQFDVRMLDFEKSFMYAEKVAQECQEDIEKCEDNVIKAVENIKAMLAALP
jgi:1D-myo-inositol-tetrakisphosphate 5-kinase/inositol-polyphosphate multikinase